MIFFYRDKNLNKKLNIDTILVICILSLLIYSVLLSWSASGQNYRILFSKIIQNIIGILVMFIFSKIPPRLYEEYAPHLYIICIIMLLSIIPFGQIIKGAKRWISLGFLNFQPSEIAKISVILLSSRIIYRNDYPSSNYNILLIIIITIIPALLVAIQPDLGTAILIICSGFFAIFLSGISWKSIMILKILILSMLPIFWFFMHEYQKDRILTLLNPSRDPLGAGYHIIQSKIAIGSGGLLGKGWLEGTQSQLDFIPERQTDFIFSVLGEEMGFLGTTILMFLYVVIITRSLFISIKTKNIFNKIVVSNLTFIFFIYIFVNIGMVSGILPVVGIPLPLISYGGSSLTIIMAGFGICMSVNNSNKELLYRNL